MNGITVVGHRGAAGRAPENTLASFQRAVDTGADAVECDVRVSLDGVPVIMHDESVDRTTNGTGNIAELNLSYLRQLEAGRTERIPTLRETLDLCRGKIELEIELKTDLDGSLIVSEVREAGNTEIRFISFSVKALSMVMDLAPEFPRSLLCGRIDPDYVARARACEADVISVNFKNMIPETAADIHDNGFKAAVWTPNTPEDIREALDLGVDRITSDYPDRVMFAARS